MAEGVSSFHLLDERIQRFIWSEGWETLRDAQERALPLVLSGSRDVIVAAATAAGKTEAAFFPALTHFVRQKNVPLIVYLSPLKALINDQFGRLQRLCDILEIPVWPWHGDVSASVKERFRKRPEGVLLITPESLEAMLCNRGSTLAQTFAGTSFFVIDEMHAFIGSERGKQLQSLMHRLDLSIGSKVPRIGLSATLGDMRLAADFMRPGGAEGVAMVISSASGGDLLISVKGYEEPLAIQDDPLESAEPPPNLSVSEQESLAELDDEDEDESDPVAPGQVAAHLFKVLRGSNNLVFPNSRTEVERYTMLLNEMCDALKVPHEFWPHHGSLSKAMREDTESALKRKDTASASAICTNTLELGIDIGAVKSVCQVGAPYSVASLRQRLGRSGRRKGEPAILRGYSIEWERDTTSSIVVELRMKTLQITAAILLLLEGWFEPPMSKGMHLSTLVQQLMSMISQTNGATIGQIHRALCAPGAPFAAVTVPDLVELVRTLGAKGMLMQDPSGALLHAPSGEREVNHYSFYAAFAAEEEYKVSARGKIMGSMPVGTMLLVGQRILFGGKRWTIEKIDDEQKILFLKKSKGGAKPIFQGGPGRVHTKVRQRMLTLLEGTEVPIFLDPVAKRFLQEARISYAARDLSNGFLVNQQSYWIILTWMGDPANEALACLLNLHGWTATVAGPGLELLKAGRDETDLMNTLCLIAREPTPDLDILLADVNNLKREKWDHVLPDSLLRKSYASLNLDLVEATAWADSWTKDKPTPLPREEGHDIGYAMDSESIDQMIRAASLDYYRRYGPDPEDEAPV